MASRKTAIVTGAGTGVYEEAEVNGNFVRVSWFKFCRLCGLGLDGPIGFSVASPGVSKGLDFGICGARAHQNERALGKGGVDEKCHACERQPVVDVVQQKEWGERP